MYIWSRKPISANRRLNNRLLRRCEWLAQWLYTLLYVVGCVNVSCLRRLHRFFLYRTSKVSLSILFANEKNRNTQHGHLPFHLETMHGSFLLVRPHEKLWLELLGLLWLLGLLGLGLALGLALGLTLTLALTLIANPMHFPGIAPKELICQNRPWFSNQ